MNKLKLARFASNLRTSIIKNSPSILTVAGITGMWSTVALAVSATPKATRSVELKKEELQVEKLKAVDVVKATWKHYIPMAIMGSVSTACLIGANSVNTRRNAALAAAYALSETALIEYRDKVVETIGVKKEQAIRESIAKDTVEKNPVTRTEVIMTSNGDTLFYDPTSDRYFNADLEHVRRVINDLNERMLNGSDLYVSLNELYSELGLRYTLVGDELGWNVSKWGSIKIDFYAQRADDGRPCLVMDYHQNPPRRDYSKLA